MSKKLNNPINGSTLNSAPAERCFASFNLGWELDQALEKLNYKVPTLVQSASIPSALTGVDIVGQARTGTGKTAAFVIPIIKDIADRRPKFPKSLIIAPTRELASQIKIEAQNLGQFKKIRIVDIVGGRPIEGQAQKLRKGAHIVVGTPGRILDLYKRGWLILDHVNKVVIDEADEMFSMGFYKDVEEIISNTPNDRQTFLFSATMSDNVKNIAFKHMKNPKIIRVKETEAQLCNIKEHFHLVSS
ncbi:MAG: DEAD/DEAH box helicase, partial [Nitrospinota bacterium]